MRTTGPLKSKAFFVRMTPAEAKAITTAAREQNISRSELVRRIIRSQIQEKK